MAKSGRSSPEVHVHFGGVDIHTLSPVKSPLQIIPQYHDLLSESSNRRRPQSPHGPPSVVRGRTLSKDSKQRPHSLSPRSRRSWSPRLPASQSFVDEHHGRETKSKGYYYAKAVHARQPPTPLALGDASPVSSATPSSPQSLPTSSPTSPSLLDSMYSPIEREKSPVVRPAKAPSQAAVVTWLRRSPSPHASPPHTNRSRPSSVKSPTAFTLCHWLPRLRRDGRELEFAPKSIRSDYGTVRMAVQQDWRALEFAAPELRDSFNIVMAAVCQHWSALAFASWSLRRSKPVVLAAVLNSWRALELVSSDLLGDEDILLEAVQQEWKSLDFAPRDLRNNKRFMLAALNVHPKCLKFAGPAVRDDRALVMRAVTEDGSVLQFASLRLQRSRDVMLAAVKTHGAALKYGGEELQRDAGVVMEAVKQDGGALRFASIRLREAKCPNGHSLTAFQAPWPGWYCSSCAPAMKPSERVAAFAKGAWLHGCRACEFDLCDACFHDQTFSPETSKTGSEIALAAVDSVMASMISLANSSRSESGAPRRKGSLRGGGGGRQEAKNDATANDDTANNNSHDHGGDGGGSDSGTVRNRSTRSSSGVTSSTYHSGGSSSSFLSSQELVEEAAAANAANKSNAADEPGWEDHQKYVESQEAFAGKVLRAPHSWSTSATDPSTDHWRSSSPAPRATPPPLLAWTPETPPPPRLLETPRPLGLRSSSVAFLPDDGAFLRRSPSPPSYLSPSPPSTVSTVSQGQKSQSPTFSYW